MLRRALTINKKPQNRDQPEQPKGICNKKKEKEKEKRDIKMDDRGRSVKKYDAKKPFVTKASDNHTSECL